MNGAITYLLKNWNIWTNFDFKQTKIGLILALKNQNSSNFDPKNLNWTNFDL